MVRSKSSLLKWIAHDMLRPTENITMAVSKKGGINEQILNSVTGLAGPELL